jgi:hypothetical protein
MPMNLYDEGANLFRIEIRGILHKADFDRCAQELKDHIDRVGAVKVLFVLDQFSGWAPTERWNDLSFYLTHGERIERIGIVGDERWRSETLMFAGEGMRKAPVKFFPAGYAAVARVWLAGE